MQLPATVVGRRGIRVAVCLAGLWAGIAAGAVAGGGPENLLLVVNRKSTRSLTIANHYVRLRRIPAGNVLTLTWDPKTETTDVETFRKQILAPVLTALRKRQLFRQIDYVVYSSDFPWGIELKGDVKEFLQAPQHPGRPKSDRSPAPDENGSKQPRQWPKLLSQVGSITGLTYLLQPVIARSPAYFQLNGNWYFRRPTPAQEDAPTLGFKSSYSFGPGGELVDSPGRRYLLSMMLGVTAGRGNTVEEVLDYLRRSAAADGLRPRGTIYFVQNRDVRSRVRDHEFPEAVRALKKLGVDAEILEGKVPVNKQDVQGVTLGTASFNWKSSGSTILPGAICEHFTSFGGVMRKDAGQTPLSEFLRYGAAGACGTVTEPFAIPAKFPSAMVHVHYARGCTLAEAFYQSVAGPYQLLIVGDPLCRPWANVPRVKLGGVEPGAVVRGNLTLTPSATFPGGSKAERFELFVDGWLRAASEAGESIELDTRRLADGYHELRVVAIEAGLIRSQGRHVLSITTANHGRKITASLSPTGTLSPGSPLVVTASSPRSVGIVVLHNSHAIGRLAGESGRIEIDAAVLGSGPIRLRVVGLSDGGPSSYVWARPLELVVKGKGT